MKNAAKIKDSFGTQLYEGDIIEYYDWCHAFGERYVEEGVYNEECSKQSPYGEFVYEELPVGFKERAISKGFTCIHEWEGTYHGLELFKPAVGVVKWNYEHVTYEPLICSDGWFSFFCLINKPDEEKGTTSYCKKIGNVIDNPELL